jgi:hypothetical protein
MGIILFIGGVEGMVWFLCIIGIITITGVVIICRKFYNYVQAMSVTMSGSWYDSDKINDLPLIGYEDFIKFYGVKPSSWGLRDGYVLKLNMKSVTDKTTYISWGYGALEKQIKECGFKFEFIDYLKYSKYKAKIEKEQAIKKNIEDSKKKNKADLEKTEKLLNSIKKDLAEM